jgi:hypothetical protein
MQPIVLGAVARTLEPNLDVLTTSICGDEVCDVKFVDAKSGSEGEPPLESTGTLTE